MKIGTIYQITRVTSQKTVMFKITAIRTSNFTYQRPINFLYIKYFLEFDT